MKNFTKSILFLAAGLMMAANVWGDAFDHSSNIAQGKTAKAGWSRRGECPNKNAGEIPDKAVDGNTGSHFIAYANNSADLSWWAVDLGATYRLNSFNAVWNNGRTPSHYLIQIMTELPSDFADDVLMSDAGWVTAIEVNEAQTEGTGGNHYDFGAISARYVRLVSKNRKEIGLSEFEIYADAPASNPEVTPTLGSAATYSDLAEGSATLTLTATDHNGNALHTFLVQDQMGKYYRATTDGSDHVTISGLDNRRYAFTVWAIEEGCLSASSMSVIVGAGTFNAETNLALNKPAYAYRYRENSNSYAPEKANDGNLGSHWNAGSDSGEAIAEADRDKVWWYVDLQDQYELKYISLYWTNAYSQNFIVQVRKNAPSLADAGDDSAWDTFLEYSGTPTVGDQEANSNLYGDVAGSLKAFKFVPKGRYIRFRAKDATNWNWGVQLRELRVYGNGYLPVDEVAPDLSAASYNGLTLDHTGVKFNVTATDDQTSPVVDYRVIDANEVVHNVTASEGVIIVTNLPSGKNQNVTIYALDEAGNKSSERNVEITYVNPNDNLALNKTTNACVDINTGEGHAKAVDGKENTDWTSWSNADHTNDWWYVDLGDYYNIRRIEVVWTENRHSTDYDIQYRQDAPEVDGATASEWHTISEFSGKSGNQAIDIVDTKAQYICMRSRSGNTGDQVRLAEFRVFGKAYAITDNEAPVISEASYNGVSADWTELQFNITVSDNVTANEDLVYVVEDPDGAEHAATYSAGVISVTGMPTFKEGDFTIYATDAVDNKSVGYVVEDVSYVNPTENIAKDKNAYACHTASVTETPGKAVDGEIGNGHDWTSYGNAHHNNDWWYVDLGDFYDIRRIEVVWSAENRISTDFDIQYRQNAPAVDGATASEWHTFSELAGKSGDQAIDIANTQAQYICMRSRAGAVSDQVRLAEFRVFGKAFATPDFTDPVISEASYNGVSADWTALKFNITVSDNVTANADLVYMVEDPDGVEHVATYSAGVISVTGMPTFKEGDITIYATDAAENKSTGYVVEDVSYVNPDDNLAVDKTRYGCKTYNEEESPAKANDGSTSTHWTSYTSGTPTNEWWYVDLGDFYDIRRIEVVWKSGYSSTNYSIQYRQNAPAVDGSTADEWDTFSEFSDKSGNQEIDIENTKAQFICMRSSAREEGGQLRLAELRVFGKAFAVSDANPPVITTAYVHYNDDGKAYLHLEATDLEDGDVTRFRVTNTNTSTTELLMTNGDDEIVIDGLTIGTTYTFQIQALDNVDNASDVTELKVNVPAPTSANIAPLGTASAGYEHQASEAAGKANDGNANTLWTNFGCSNNEDEWWAVKLDGVYHLTKIAVLWKDDNYASKYTLKVRMTDADEWETLTQITNTTEELAGKEGIDRVVETLVDKITGQVRLDIDEDHTGGFTRVYEVMVYADAKMISFVDDGNNSDLIDEYNDHEAIVVLNRDITADNTWYTLCLPFDMSAEKVSEVFGASTIATLESSEDRGSLIHLNFNYVDAIQAGKPYLIKPGQDFVSGTTISNVTIQNVDPSAEGYKAEATHMHFQGTFNKIMLTGEDKRYVSANNELYSPKPSDGSKIGAFRCYFTIPSGSSASAPGKQARIVFGPQNATGIDLINDSSKSNGKLLINGVFYIIRDGNTYNAQGMLIK